MTAALIVRLVTGAEAVEQADQRGAIATLAKQPFAGWMLALLAFGLAAFAIWRFYELVTGDESAFTRLQYAVSALVYAVLSVSAVVILLPGSDEGGDDGTASLTSRAMDLPGGRVLVGAAGLVLIGVAGYFVVTGVRRKFMKRLELTEHSAPWATFVGVMGWVGRGVATALVGGFVIRAAIEHNPGEAKGLDGALKALLAESYGRPLLVAVAIGFAAYAALCVVEAKYRRYDT